MNVHRAPDVWRFGAAAALVNAVVTAVDWWTTGTLLALPAELGAGFAEGNGVAAAGHEMFGVVGYCLLVALPLLIVQCVVLAHRPRSWKAWTAWGLVAALSLVHLVVVASNVRLTVLVLL